MTRQASLAALALLTILPLIAETPAGWKMRLDKSTSATDPDASGDIKFEKMGSGFHATNPAAAVFWNPANTIAGNYSIKGTFALMAPARHTEFYGLIFGGSELEGSGQNYIYFMVAQDGTWLLKRREGDASAPTITAKTTHDAVVKPDASGKSKNALEVRVLADKIELFVNGAMVHTEPKAGLAAKTDGIYGIRINHHLEVHVDGFAVSKL